MTDPQILALPACREMAERMALEWRGTEGPWPEPHLMHVPAFARILSDLDRPESRDAWVRWLRDPVRWSGGRHCLVLDLRDNPAALRAAILEVYHA